MDAAPPNTPMDAPRDWTPGMEVQIAATYRQKSTGRLMVLMDAESTANRVCLAPQDIVRWEGTSQQFANAFEFVAPYQPGDNAAT